MKPIWSLLFICVLAVAGSASANECVLPVAICQLLKQQFFNQTNATGPIDSGEITHVFQLVADSSLPNDIALTNGNLSWPGGSRAGELFSFRLNEPFSSQLAMDATYPSTNYTVTFDYNIPLLGTSGVATATIPLLGDTYPNPPTILNYPATQAVPPGRDFVLQFQPFLNATTNDRVAFAYYSGGNPAQISAPVSASSIAIPGSTLTASSDILCILTFQRVVASDTGETSCIDYFAIFSRATIFHLLVTDVTTGPVRPTLEIISPPGGNVIAFRFDTIPGQTYRVIASTNLPVWNPITLLTTNAGTSVTFTEPTSLGASARFFQVVTP